MARSAADRAVVTHRQLSGPAYHGDFITRYDELRPKPPRELFELLLSLAPANPPALVVDLGAGTGISTAAWSELAVHVIGVDLNMGMLRVARRAANVVYTRASADQTGLADGCADVITCAQSFHWMDPDATIAEIARLLRSGGIFAAYDYDWPPLIDWDVDAAFLRVIRASGVEPSRPDKARHIERLLASGRFRGVREVFLHARELVDADHITRLALAFGPVARKLNEGVTSRELGLDKLAETVGRRLDPGTNAAWWSYRLRIGLAVGTAATLEP